MNRLFFIAWRNIIKRPLRSAALILIAAFLSFTVFAGTIVSASLRNGFASLNDRLGADIMVVPHEAITKSNFENMVLQGNVGYFYMDGKYVDELKEVEGVGKLSAQYYLASVKSGCCTMRVQIIGFDPETDFAIQPWIKKANGKPVGYMDVVVGNDLNAFVGDELSFFGEKVKVAAKLDKTGTSYDTAVFATGDTVKQLIKASLNKQLNEYADIDAGNAVSCVLIDVAEGYSIDEVANDINIHNKKIEAIRASDMISGVSESLDGVSELVKALTAVIWILALFVLIIAFYMMTGERKKEFAVMRVLGASRKKLAAIVLSEGMFISAIGCVTGVLFGALVIVSFSGAIESSLGLPFLLPGALDTVLVALISSLLSILAGAGAVLLSAGRISKIDTGKIIRSGE